MRVQIVSKGDEDPHPWITPKPPPWNRLPVFDVQCSLVNVTRRGTIINVCSCILQIVSHMSILNILLINFFIIRSILFHNKGLWLSRWHFKIIFYIIFSDTTCELQFIKVWVYQKATRKFIAKALFKIGNGECSGRGRLKRYYFSCHYKTIGQFLSQVSTLHDEVLGDQIGTGKGNPDSQLKTKINYRLLHRIYY